MLNGIHGTWILPLNQDHLKPELPKLLPRTYEPDVVNDELSSKSRRKTEVLSGEWISSRILAPNISYHAT
jgi:hypothetical protein